MSLNRLLARRLGGKIRGAVFPMIAVILALGFSPLALGTAWAKDKTPIAPTGGTAPTPASQPIAPDQAETPQSAAPASAALSPDAPAAASEAYRLNGGDTLHISVYGEDKLDRDVSVEPDGGISFPLVGTVNAKNLTLQELQHKIADKLREGNMFPNITDPEVTVSLVKSTGNSISVIGQVKTPGTFTVDTQMDVMQALSLAGGLTPFASKSRILVLRRDSGGKQTKLPFDYSAIEEGTNLDSNVVLQGGDVVVVPQAGLGF